MASQLIQDYLRKSRTISDLGAASSLLNWDQETYMPSGAAELRAEQIATLDALVHQMTVATDYQELLSSLENASAGELADWESAAVKESLRAQRLAIKLPEEYVRDFSRTASLAQHAWKKARAESDFSLFVEPLRHLVELKRREAEYYGYNENPYDALIDLYEPGMTVAELRPAFEKLRDGTTRLLARIRESGSTVDDSLLFTDFEPNKQVELSRSIVEAIGFNMKEGRVDISAHPFCTSFGISDVRLTTRVFADDLRSCLFGLIHEAGHGMYEQGIDRHLARTSLAAGTSMGIHESQSLFWENMVGRSEAFWVWAFPRLQAAFPERLQGVDRHEFFRMINAMKPSFIRVEADELTYNLHIILRFEIEEALINGTMEVDEIPDTWNRKMHEYLGITPPDDAHGALQDVHWSFGGFGYFPSYTLGKLYAAMLYNQAAAEIPDLEGRISAGEFAPLLDWLRQKVHRWGKAKRSAELVQEICGRPLTSDDFLAYVERKIDRVYGG
jgi:carboxypeptidase Taq